MNGQYGANEDSLLHRAVLENDRHPPIVQNIVINLYLTGNLLQCSWMKGEGNFLSPVQQINMKREHEWCHYPMIGFS